jgi:5-methylcytosine-specific restriction endonuclease McrA
MTLCTTCNKETTNPKFCSRSCSAINSNKISIKRRKTNKCKKCSCLIYKGINYCKSCYTIKSNDPNITISELIYKKHHRSSAYALIRAKARKAVKHLEKKCSKCSYDKHVEVCHIKPISSFCNTSTISEINNLNNLILLCPNCHWEFDNLSQ